MDKVKIGLMAGIFTAILAAAASAQPVVIVGGYGVHHGHYYGRHARFHDELEHNAYHRELEHRDAHRYPMSWRQHERLHDELDHDAFHDWLEHRDFHRHYYRHYPRRYYGGGHSYHLWFGF